MNSTNSTGSPTSSPTTTITTVQTESPTSTTIIQTESPTPLTTTPPPTNRIDVIRLPDYKSHDAVDGFFLAIGSSILLIMLILCLQKINLDRRRMMNRLN